MKRIIIILSALVIALTFTACSKSEKEDDQNNLSTEADTDQSTETKELTDKAAEPTSNEITKATSVTSKDQILEVITNQTVAPTPTQTPTLTAARTSAPPRKTSSPRTTTSLTTSFPLITSPPRTTTLPRTTSPPRTTTSSRITSPPRITTTTLTVEGMTCNSCVNSVKGAVSGLDGVRSVTVVLGNGRVTVVHESGVSVSTIRNTIISAGYTIR